MYFNFSYDQESNDRNYIIISIHGNIPSYSLWEDVYIKQQNINCRLGWWKNLDIPENKKIENELKSKWVIYLNGISNLYSKSS